MKNKELMESVNEESEMVNTNPLNVMQPLQGFLTKE